MRRILFGALLAVAMCGAAYAQSVKDAHIPFPEEVYVTQYFGTTLIVFMTEQLPHDPDEWWGNSLPEKIYYEPATLIAAVNAKRGKEPLLDEEGWYIEVRDEISTDGGWEYAIRFFEMRPSEVMVILEELGGAETLFPNGQFSFMPCLERNFSGSTESLNKPIVMTLAQREYTFDPKLTVDKLYDKVSAAFEEAYGQAVASLDLYLSSYKTQDGSVWVDLSAYVQLPAG